MNEYDTSPANIPDEVGSVYVSALRCAPPRRAKVSLRRCEPSLVGGAPGSSTSGPEGAAGLGLVSTTTCTFSTGFRSSSGRSAGSVAFFADTVVVAGAAAAPGGGGATWSGGSGMSASDSSAFGAGLTPGFTPKTASSESRQRKRTSFAPSGSSRSTVASRLSCLPLSLLSGERLVETGTPLSETPSTSGTSTSLRAWPSVRTKSVSHLVPLTLSEGRSLQRTNFTPGEPSNVRLPENSCARAAPATASEAASESTNRSCKCGRRMGGSSYLTWTQRYVDACFAGRFRLPPLPPNGDPPIWSLS